MHRRAPTSRLGAIEREILEDLSGSDLFIGFLLSAHSTSRMYKIARERAARRYRTKLAVDRLEKQGLIRRVGEKLEIADSGIRAIDATVGKTRASLKAKRWDGKWRIVSYDIPERYKRLRDSVRSVLKRAGFVKLQHSVWIFPHECGELSALLQKETRLGRYILYGVLEKIGDEERLRKTFSIRT